MADIEDQGFGPEETMSIMESMGKKEPRPRRSFTPEFKAEIVELSRRGDRSAEQIAKDFDLTETQCACGSARPRSTRLKEPALAA